MLCYLGAEIMSKSEITLLCFLKWGILSETQYVPVEKSKKQYFNICVLNVYTVFHQDIITFGESHSSPLA